MKRNERNECDINLFLFDEKNSRKIKFFEERRQRWWWWRIYTHIIEYSKQTYRKKMHHDSPLCLKELEKVCVCITIALYSNGRTRPTRHIIWMVEVRAIFVISFCRSTSCHFSYTFFIFNFVSLTCVHQTHFKFGHSFHQSFDT